MRATPDKKYCPHPKMKNNMTIYEMAYSMDDNNPQSASSGFPYLISWLFDELFLELKYYTIDDVALDINSLLNTKNLIAFFMYNYLNREICSSNPLVFRSKLCKEILNMFLDFDLFKKLSEISEATTLLQSQLNENEEDQHVSNTTRTDNLTENVQRDVDNEKIDENTSTSNNIRTDNLTENMQRTVETDSTDSSNGTNANTTVSDDDATRTLNTLKTDSSTGSTSSSSSNNGSSRVLGVDYPQSTANHSQIGQWDYASDAQDTVTSNSSSDSNQSSNSGTSADTGTITDSSDSTVTSNGTTTNSSTGHQETGDDATRTNTGTQTNNGTLTSNIESHQDIDENILRTNTGTQTNANAASDTKIHTQSQKYNNMNDIQGLELKMQLLDKFKSVYRILNTRIENAFISIYVDEDRDGWIDPSVIWEVPV